jgi:hypothetical protein
MDQYMDQYLDQYHVLERFEADEALVTFLDQLLKSRGLCDAPAGIRGLTSQQLRPLVLRKRRTLLDRALATVALGGRAQLAVQALQVVVPYCVTLNNLLGPVVCVLMARR